MNANLNNDKSNFIKLITENKIQIPIIQRDYAQGRNDSKTKEIRKNFLSDLISALESGTQNLNLDFVYGSTKGTAFIPLDGQQRLTTLFLLHWYLCPNDEKLKLLQFSNENSVSSRFTYETRISSGDFCNRLTFITFQTISDNIARVKQSLNNKINDNINKLHELKENCKNDEAINPEEKKKYEQEIKKNEEDLKLWTLSKGIKDESWFMWAWEKDPTIKSMLVMLDDMDKKLQAKTKEERSTMWDNLHKGIISFHLLPLEKFDLSDELYVKMNARGKVLSDFDIFKSTMEEQMRSRNVEMDIQNIWRENIDSNWIDIFWNKLAKPTIENIETEKESNMARDCVKSVEKSYLNFLKEMMLFHLFMDNDYINCIKYEFRKDDVSIDYDEINRMLPLALNENDDVLAELRDYSARKENDILSLMSFFSKTQFFSKPFFEFVEKVFDSIIYLENEVKHEGSDLIDGIDFEFEKGLFKTFIDEKPTYSTRVQFYALLKFFEYNKAKKVSKDETKTLQKELNSWMRVIRNLSVNTNYNSSEIFQNSLKEINRWTEKIYKDNSETKTILDFLTEEDKLTGFDGAQLSDEKIKATLMTPRSDLKDQKEWTPFIRIAEEHKYFLGQIRFLLEWSKESEKEYNIEKFENYLTKIYDIFNDTGLQINLREKYLFNNAMMAAYEWYLHNNCFMENNKSRDWSWKRYLREEKSKNIQELLDKWDNRHSNFVDFCTEYISKNKPTDWRKCFIEYPNIYDQLENKRIETWNNDTNQICLLSKIRWSSIHKELRTYYWFLKNRKDQKDKYLDSREELHKFSAVFYRQENKEFSVKFIPNNRYVVSSNFNTNIDSMVFKPEDDRWEQYFSSEKAQQVEELLEKINKTCVENL